MVPVLSEVRAMNWNERPGDDPARAQECAEQQRLTDLIAATRAMRLSLAETIRRARRPDRCAALAAGPDAAPPPPLFPPSLAGPRGPAGVS